MSENTEENSNLTEDPQSVKPEGESGPGSPVEGVAESAKTGVSENKTTSHAPEKEFDERRSNCKDEGKELHDTVPVNSFSCNSSDLVV